MKVQQNLEIIQYFFIAGSLSSQTPWNKEILHDLKVLLYFRRSYDFNSIKVQESIQIQSWSSSREETIRRNPHLLGCHRDIHLFIYYKIKLSYCIKYIFNTDSEVVHKDESKRKLLLFT